MHLKPLLIAVLAFSFSCNNNAVSAYRQQMTEKYGTGKDNPYPRIKDIPLPPGFERVAADPFGLFLRNTALKKDKTVYLFDGTLKYNQGAQFAVLDITTGNRDLQQCADAVMRLRAEYFYAAKQFDQIGFIDNNRKSYRFNAPYSREHFSKYLQQVFGMCGSASLAKQLKPVTVFSKIMPGDVIIRGGFPGHAVLVMDVVENAAKEKLYLLAQSYMPAQDIHVLINPMDPILSPWYKVTDSKTIETPEYLFYTRELKRW